MTFERGVYAVIFTSTLRSGDDLAYLQAAERMEELARSMPGFLGFDSARTGLLGITVSYWESEQAIQGWRNHPEHLDAQAQGKAQWYENYQLHVTCIERSYGFSASESGT